MTVAMAANAVTFQYPQPDCVACTQANAASRYVTPMGPASIKICQRTSRRGPLRTTAQTQSAPLPTAAIAQAAPKCWSAE